MRACVRACVRAAEHTTPNLTATDKQRNEWRTLQPRRQHPNAFEFTGDLLLLMADHYQSGWFGAFVNCIVLYVLCRGT